MERLIEMEKYEILEVENHGEKNRLDKNKNMNPKVWFFFKTMNLVFFGIFFAIFFGIFLGIFFSRFSTNF